VCESELIRFSSEMVAQLDTAEEEVRHLSKALEHLERMAATVRGQAAEIALFKNRLLKESADSKHEISELQRRLAERDDELRRVEQEQYNMSSAERSNKFIASVQRELAMWKEKAESFQAKAEGCRPEADAAKAETRGLHAQIESLKKTNEALQRQCAVSSNFQAELDRLRQELLCMSSEMGLIKSKANAKQAAVLRQSDAPLATNGGDSFDQRVEESLSKSLNLLKAKQAHISSAEKASRGTEKDLDNLERQDAQPCSSEAMLLTDLIPMAPLPVTPAKKEKSGWLSMLGTRYFCTVNVNLNVLKFTDDSAAGTAGERPCSLCNVVAIGDSFPLFRSVRIVVCTQRYRRTCQFVRRELHCR
jgi:chromosome segregation ATPase